MVEGSGGVVIGWMFTSPRWGGTGTRENTSEIERIDTKNGYFFEAGVTISKPSFWVSMLVFGVVDIWSN